MTPRCIESSTLIQNLHLPHLHLPHLQRPHLQRPCGRVGGRRGSAALEWVAGRGVWCGLLMLVLVLIGMAGLGAPAAGQGTPAGSAAPTFPTPLVSAGFGKQPAITWPDYQVWEQCYVHSNYGIDRPESDSMFQPPRACLQRLGLDTISPGLYWKVRLFAIRVGADSVLRSLVARQLSAMPVGANIPRAELLDSVVNDFVSVPGGVPAARAYLAQIDALGPTAWFYRIDARETIVRAITPDTEPDAYLALYREEMNIIHDPKVESLPEMQKEVGRSGMTRLEMAQRIGDKLHEWNAIKTQSRDSIAHLPDLPQWFNGPAPAVHCDYYFPTPEAAAPLDGPPPAVPIAGRLSLLVFVGSSVDGAALRQLHQTLPALPIVLVDGITGAVGLTIVEDPARAAVLMHQALTAQGVPGALCLAKRQLKTTPSGHVLVLADPNTVTYHHEERPRQSAYLVDPTGVVVGVEREVYGGFPGGGWSDFVWYLKRIAAKYAATTPSR